MPRDSLFGETWLKELGRQVENAGYSPEPFLTRVRERLELGDARYGETFRQKDLILEAREEAWDLASYAVLETEVRNLNGRGGQHHLQRAALLAAMADYHLRLATRE